MTNTDAKKTKKETVADAKQKRTVAEDALAWYKGAHGRELDRCGFSSNSKVRYALTAVDRNITARKLSAFLSKHSDAISAGKVEEVIKKY